MTKMPSRLQFLALVAKQLHLGELVGKSRWAFDSTGILSFGNNHHWHAQILGTESYETNTWLWAWANTGSNLPPAVVQSSLQMKRLGEEQSIPELIQPQLPLSADINGQADNRIKDALANGPVDLPDSQWDQSNLDLSAGRRCSLAARST
jgi:hypothetical protein